MNRIRAALRYNVAEETCVRDCRKEKFWDGIVRNYVDVLSTHDVTLKGFMQRARGMHQATVAFDPESLDNLSFLSSSVGDLDRLSLFAAFKGRDSGRPVVTEVHHSVSSNLAMTLAICWQYQGKLTVSFESGVSYYSTEEMGTLGRV